MNPPEESGGARFKGNDRAGYFLAGALIVTEMSNEMATRTAATTRGNPKPPEVSLSQPPVKGPAKPANPQAVNKRP